MSAIEYFKTCSIHAERILFYTCTLGLARTVCLTGKTLSYAIPIVERLRSLMPKVQRAHGPYCIAVLPTREVDVCH